MYKFKHYVKLFLLDNESLITSLTTSLITTNSLTVLFSIDECVTFDIALISMLLIMYFA